MAVNRTKLSPHDCYQHLLQLLEERFPRALKTPPLAAVATRIQTHGIITDQSPLSLTAGAEFSLYVLAMMRRKLKKTADIGIDDVRIIHAAMRLFRATKSGNDEIYQHISKNAEQIFPQWPKNYAELLRAKKGFIKGAAFIAQAEQAVEVDDLGTNPLSAIVEKLEEIIVFAGPHDRGKERLKTLKVSAWKDLKGICDQSINTTKTKKQFTKEHSTQDVHKALFAISQFPKALESIKQKILTGKIPPEIAKKFSVPPRPSVKVR